MNALVIMTRIPHPGKTKTRLMEILTAEQCAKLHECFLKDIFNSLNNLKDKTDIYLSHTLEGDISILENIVPSNVIMFPQTGECLGERMLNSIKKLINRGYSKVLLIGSDIPDVQYKDILEGFNVLDESDMVIGPTIDGGYYLIGMKKLHIDIFNNNLKWGNKSVFDGTLSIANKLGIKTGLVTKHRDIDTKDDLKDFMNNIKLNYKDYKNLPENTVEFINECWSDRNAKKYFNESNT